MRRNKQKKRGKFVFGYVESNVRNIVSLDRNCSPPRNFLLIVFLLFCAVAANLYKWKKQTNKQMCVIRIFLVTFVNPLSLPFYACVAFTAL